MKVYFGIGTNLGDRTENLKNAIEALSRIGKILATSKIYETTAWGITEQDDFLNQVIIIDTNLKPQEILDAIQKIEKSLGRTPTIQWGPRLIDIDILFIADKVITEKNLTIPHPHIANRNFVLIPMMELEPDFIHPVSKLPIIELYEMSEDDCDVIMME